MKIGPFTGLQHSALEIYVVGQDEAFADDETHEPFPGVVTLRSRDAWLEVEPEHLDAAIRYLSETWDGVTEQPHVDAADRRYAAALEKIWEALREARRGK